MNTLLKSSLVALSVAILVTFACSSCENHRRPATGGSHNMGVGPKDNYPMPDANMPGRR